MGEQDMCTDWWKPKGEMGGNIKMALRR